jgi:hypothetical protein
VTRLIGFEIPSDSPVFLAILGLHIPLALLALATGMVAMLKSKRRGGHTRFGSIYFWSLGAVFCTSVALAGMRWSDDYYLFILGAVAFAAAVIGRAARRQRWRTAIDLHIVGMGLSYVAMLTAFYVDNGKNLPIWRDLPHVLYWVLPSAVGIPLIVWSLSRRGSRVSIRAAAAHKLGGL